jgi:tetratricopeptide (TPR) repeat protein
MNHSWKYFLLLLFLLLLQACASNAKQGIAPAPVEDRSVLNKQNNTGYSPSARDRDGQLQGDGTSVGGKSARQNTDKQPVVVALLEDAETKMASGDKASAAATLERALRLEPKNAMLWHRLGLLRLQQKNWQQAINLAKKSNSLAAGDYSLQAANWKLIAQANSRAGDKNAAKLAADMAWKLEQLK